MNNSYSVNDCILLNIKTFTEERGSISVIDNELPFEVKRVFWLYHIKDGKGRGGHALLEGSEIMCSLHGSFEVELFDGIHRVCITLDNQEKGLLICPGIWFSTNQYKNDGVSLILASEVYDRNNYTYDFEEYLQLRR